MRTRRLLTAGMTAMTVLVIGAGTAVADDPAATTQGGKGGGGLLGSLLEGLLGGLLGGLL